MGLIELLKSRRADIFEIAARHGARNVRLFGSVARGEADDASDVDFLVDMEQDRSLMDHAALVVELEKLIGRKVDVAPDDCLKAKVKARVLKDAIPL